MRKKINKEDDDIKVNVLQDPDYLLDVKPQSPETPVDSQIKRMGNLKFQLTGE